MFKVPFWHLKEILHDQNDINRQQEETNTEIALQIEVLNDALEQLRMRPAPSVP